MPRTANGKLDRAALANLPLERTERSRQGADAPQTPVEELVEPAESHQLLREWNDSERTHRAVGAASVNVRVYVLDETLAPVPMGSWSSGVFQNRVKA
jgi:hypothetical protein